MIMEDKTLAVAIFLAGLGFLVTVTLTALAAAGSTVFRQPIGALLLQYPKALLPNGWAAATILIVVLMWVALSLTFLITNVVRQKNDESPIFTRPLCYTFMLSQALFIACLFMWDSVNPVGTCMFLAFLALISWHLAGFFSKRLYRGKWDLSMTDLWLYRLLPQNGLAMYAAWATVTWLISLSVAVEYGRPLEPLEERVVDGNMLSLYLLCVLLVLWVPLENFWYFDELQYVFTPYLVVKATLIGILCNANSELTSSDRELVVVVLVTTGVLFLMRLSLMAYTHFRGHPFKKTTESMLQITSHQY